MATTLTQLINAFADLNVLVIGDVMLDSYLKGTADRLCREAPVPIVTLTGRHDAPGGAANTAANLRSLGANVMLLSAVGDDAEAQILRRALADYDVSSEYLVEQPGRQTLAKNRVMAESHTLVRFDKGTTDAVDYATEKSLINHLMRLFPRCHAVLISDYNYGIITPRIISTLASLQARSPRTVVADSKRLRAYRKLQVTAVKPNYPETLHLLNAHEESKLEPRAQFIATHGEHILDLTGARMAAVTMDSDGAWLFERGNPPYRTYAQPARASGVAGAGDTYVSALTLALAAGGESHDAAELAAAAAEIVVARDGTAVCSADELRAAITADAKYSDLARLVATVDHYRQQGRRIVFTNGCFDILHRGHVTYLTRAKALGDVLILGVNTDASIHRLKGLDRPINALEDRVHVLAALSCVDHIVAFDEDTPVKLIEAIRPDVFVKGGDYTRERLPEAALVEQLGGRVEILPFLADRSTTLMIERIRGASVGTVAVPN